MKVNQFAWLLFLMLLVGGCKKQPATSPVKNDIAEIKAKAENGDAEAQLKFGRACFNGDGVTKDSAEAVKWFRKAADQNNIRAQFNLGICYTSGEGVTKDEAEALKWIRKAADQNFILAQYYLGVCYVNWQGVAKDVVEAAKWVRKAAEQNLPIAQYYLGAYYTYGQGVGRDEIEAAKWYRKAAEHDYAQAQFDLGVCYRDGLGVPIDAVQEVNWYRKAAEQNHVLAQYNLAACYANGEGIPKDSVESYKWYNLASAQGNQDAKIWLAVIEQHMTPDQIAEGQRRSAAFVPRKETSGLSSDNSNLSDSPTATGTGFFITDDGYLISNYHVVKGATKVRLVTSAGTVDAKVVQVDTANDLALLKAVGTFSPLPIAASRTVKLGGTVATVGFPDIGLQGFAPKLAKGEIASLSGAADDPRYFQISLPVQPGNSGGALVDARGNVVGIVAAKLNASAALAASGALPENVNYAVKSSLLLSFLESVPAVSAKLKAPNSSDEKFEDVVKSAQDAAVLVLVY